ncbi:MULTISPECIES: HNH endonuclease [Bradyrhizobium]|uniref:HNH endonuclease n=1 Tax=Bradyrhizobium TaxID=374 RepID=UPI000418BB9E|nr:MULTISPECIES: HNH endonuclease [Bradyrhizobium]UFW48168.1 hypothetical protein BaraCB756_38895 [Bradyrhizobium arachidis]
MAFKTLIEAAMQLGLRVETVEHFAKSCPKLGEDRTLNYLQSPTGPLFDEAELSAYMVYLAQPWPKPKGGGRPHIPKVISDDVKDESHHSCAICGSMDNGEVAHIEAVTHTLNNSPANLIYLCPNHHAKYDLGFKLASNITIEVIRAAKLLKKTSRCRVLKFEANATQLLNAMIHFLKHAEKKMGEASDESHRSIYVAEMKGLLASIPGLTKAAEADAQKDLIGSAPEKVLAQAAPKLAALAAAVKPNATERDIRSQAKSLVDEVDEILIEIDEVDCPHCGGRGQTGLVGDLCIYCGGSCVVTQDKHDAYDRAELDEVNCPRCGGRGQTGLVGDLCGYCKGSCVVSRQMAEDYDPAEIDEVDCPRCGGRGQTGLVGDACGYCKGSCSVSREMAEKYDPADIDEVDCPHCNGRGQTGLVGDFCAYCGGSCVVSQAKYEAYDTSSIDEEECPHCQGRGTTGLVGDTCALCKGSQVVTAAKAAAYTKRRPRSW